MTIDFVKYFFIFLFTIYICFKLLNKPIKTLKLNIIISLFAFILATISQILILKEIMFISVVPTLLLWFFISILSFNPQTSFIITTISFGISYSIHALCSFISTCIFYCLTFENGNFSFVYVSLFTAVLHTIVSIYLLQIQRFKSGLPIFNKTNQLNIATLLCIIFTFSQNYTAPNNESFKTKILSFTLFIFALTFLIFWWQAQITKSYRHRLLMRELESLRTSEAEKDALIEKLYAENDRLARITHRDNSLITALKDATIKGLCTDFENSKDMIATREKLIANIEKLAEGRSSTSSAYNKRTPREFDTGLSLLDDLLHHMDKEALEQDIMFSVHFGTLLKDFVPENVSESDLTHTVDDLLKNAFKSTRTCESRAVQLQFYKLGKHLVIEVADNGIPFEVRSLVNMGIEQLTTYEDGSGIGLMDIWSTKENYRATYHIDEYATSSPFSKKISLTFDKKNRYTIRTYRKDEILQMSRRADLQVYDNQE